MTAHDDLWGDLPQILRGLRSNYARPHTTERHSTAPVSQADGYADTYDNGCPILSEPQRDDI